jgi:hypothetical protein
MKLAADDEKTGTQMDAHVPESTWTGVATPGPAGVVNLSEPVDQQVGESYPLILSLNKREHDQVPWMVTVPGPLSRL